MNNYEEQHKKEQMQLEHLYNIIAEVQLGIIKRDVLPPDHALALTGEAEAMYFQNMKNNLETVWAYDIMECKTSEGIEREKVRKLLKNK